MSITADYHMHSYHSGDSSTPTEEMIKSSISKGLTHICFTEHYDIDFPISPRIPEPIFNLDVEDFRSELFELQEKYKNQIDVRFGIELGMQPHLTGINTKIAESYDFDFIIGSTHVVKNQDPIYTLKTGKMNDEEMYRSYFEDALFCMKECDGFDVYGHIDYIVRYGKDKDRFYSYEKYADLLDEIIETLISKGKGVEVNTGAIRNGLKEPHPCSGFLKRYREKGGEIVTAGSDAHTLADIGADMCAATEVLKKCGFKYYCTFEKRKPVFHKI